MFTEEYEGINSFLVGASKLLLEKGIKRVTRGNTCWELPAPFAFKIKNPTARWITIPERKWNINLAYAEALWIATGRNDLSLIGHYLKKLIDFSDNGEYIRGGYGPRLRYFNGITNDYKRNKFSSDFNFKFSEVDQFKFIEQCFKKDINTRRAVINIGDPPKDCFNKNGGLKNTKDFPCTRVLHFMKDAKEDKLNLTVFMRSNDILWGASAVNIFNFTYIQEYFAQILNLDIGEYFHIANNFHFYDSFKEKIEELASIKSIKDIGYHYNMTFKNLNEFDKFLINLASEEESLRQDNKSKLVDLGDDFFNDWLKVIFRYNTKSDVEFNNPVLNQLLTKVKYG